MGYQSMLRSSVIRAGAARQLALRNGARTLATRVSAHSDEDSHGKHGRAKVHENETFLTGSSSLYAEQMYENYLADRNSVHETWRKYFDDLEGGKSYEEKYFNRPTVVVSSVKQSAATSTGTTASVGATDANKTHLAVRTCFNLYHGFLQS